MLSGIYESYDTRHYNRILNELNTYGGNSEMIEIDAMKFESVVDKKNIDFLSIDTEGSELQILERINFNEYDIKVICIENNFFDENFNEFFKERGYEYYTNVLIWM